MSDYREQCKLHLREECNGLIDCSFSSFTGCETTQEVRTCHTMCDICLASRKDQPVFYTDISRDQRKFWLMQYWNSFIVFTKYSCVKAMSGDRTALFKTVCKVYDWENWIFLIFLKCKTYTILTNFLMLQSLWPCRKGQFLNNNKTSFHHFFL
jgi:hypothetical protein